MVIDHHNFLRLALNRSPGIRFVELLGRNPDIEFRVVAVGANNTIVTFHGHGLLVGPNADV